MRMRPWNNKTSRLILRPRLWGSNPLLLDWESNPYHFPKGLLVVVVVIVLSLVAFVQVRTWVVGYWIWGKLWRPITYL